MIFVESSRGWGSMLLRTGWLGVGLASIAVSAARAQGRPAPPSIDTPVVVAPRLAPAEAKLRHPRTGAESVWLSLPPRDLEYLVAVLGPDQHVPLAPAAVRQQLVAPLLQALAFADPAMSLRVAPEITKPRQSLASHARRALGRAAVKGDLPATTMASALLGSAAPSRDFEIRFRLASGSSFAAFKAEFGGARVSIPIQQTFNGVPVEHAALIATGTAGAGVGAVRGTLVRQWQITNRPPGLGNGGAPFVQAAAYRALAQQVGVERDPPARRAGPPQLVLLPYGNADATHVALRYAWRLALHGRFAGRATPFLGWLDADSLQLLKLVPLLSEVDAVAQVWRRDPGAGTAGPMKFAVNPAAGGDYKLELDNFASRLDLDVNAATGCSHRPGPASKFDSCDLAIPPGRSSPPQADFNQPPINIAADAICRKGNNVMFQQASFFALLYAYRDRAAAYGTFDPFPSGEWEPQIEADGYCNANSTLTFGACRGYYDESCPDYSTGGTELLNHMNLAHDSTAIAHEFGHSAVDNLSLSRPDGWCHPAPGAACQMPIGWAKLHDLADAWAADYENSNCIAGWAAKNVGGVNASNNCSGSNGHSEGAALPRLLEVSFPFNPAAPGDHFPEHRETAVGEYAAYSDMQIASTALWLVREALRGQLSLAGQLAYVDGFSQALRNSGFVGSDPGGSDLGIYTHLYQLEIDMLLPWATSVLAGNSTTKVLAAFAKVGIFPIAPGCLDAAAAPDPACRRGGDAVVEVDDNDPGDDIDADGLSAPERDFIRRDGPKPTFHVWTGARYLFDVSGSARPLRPQAPCHAKYKLELATRDDFHAASIVVDTGWLPVSTDTTSAGACYAAWSPSESQWTAIKSPVTAAKPLTLYYRVTTRDAGDGNERVSTRVAGKWSVAPPFAVISISGKPGL